MDPGLIVDVGMHVGDDTAYYLSLGYRVVAIDADPGLIEHAHERFAAQIRNGSLVLVHCAISNACEMVELHLSTRNVWNSLSKAISDRERTYAGSVQVPGRRLNDIFDTYGVPLYCKIDIEGQDAACLATLRATAELPMFMSVETECVGAGERLTDWQALETLRGLAALGYDGFKLVEQTSLAVLEPPSSGTTAKLNALRTEARTRLRERCGYHFRLGTSGPFGDLLDGDWLDAETARRTLLFHRRSYFDSPGALSYGFWCDWQARRTQAEFP